MIAFVALTAATTCMASATVTSVADLKEYTKQEFPYKMHKCEQYTRRIDGYYRADAFYKIDLPNGMTTYYVKAGADFYPANKVIKDFDRVIKCFIESDKRYKPIRGQVKDFEALKEDKGKPTFIRLEKRPVKTASQEARDAEWRRTEEQRNQRDALWRSQRSGLQFTREQFAGKPKDCEHNYIESKEWHKTNRSFHCEACNADILRGSSWAFFSGRNFFHPKKYSCILCEKVSCETCKE